MKQKKRWIMPLAVVGGLVLLCGAGLWYMAANTLGFSVGRCLIAGNGSYLLIEDNSPIVMHNRDKERIFDGLETGDKILVLHDGVNETYPGQTGAKWVMKLSGGTEGDIPAAVLSELTEMGWLSADSTRESDPIPESIPNEGIMPGSIGVSRTPATSAYQDKWGIKLAAKNITPIGLTLICTQQDGEPTGALQTGSFYALQQLVDGEWVDVELLPMDGEFAWTSEAWIIPTDDEAEWNVDWERLYGQLESGSYRISKSIMDFRGPGDYDEELYYAGFDIVEGKTDLTISYTHDGNGVAVPYVPGWEYEITEYAEDAMSWGVSFRPVGEDGWIDFHYWPSFGVCGTGLETKPYGNGTMGTYDGGDIWSFISYTANEGNFVATTQGVKDWWPEYGDTAMEIIESTSFTETIVD